MTTFILRRPRALLTALGTTALAAAIAVPPSSGQAVSLTSESARLTAAATGKVEYRYDALGRLSSVADPTGASATYAYDAVGNLTGITRAAAGAAVVRASTLRAADAAEVPSIDRVVVAGQRLTIVGDHLPTDPLQAKVKVAGVYATVLSARADELVVALAPGVVSAGAELVVSTEGGTAKKTLPGTKPVPEPADPTYQSLQAPKGVTALAGVIRTPSGAPIRGVEVAVEEHETETGPDGRFLLTGLDDGHAELEIDGAHAKGGNFGSYEHGVDLVEGRTTALKWITWLTPIDDGHAVRLPTKIKKELIVTTPAVPGMEVHVPAGTTIVGEDGKRVRSLSITKLDQERLPFPGAPGMPLAWTLQPGLSSVSGEGISVVYPNVTHQPPGTTIDYVNQDGDRAGIGWAVYGHGRVTEDGRQITPDAKTRLHKLYQLGVSYNPFCQYLGLFCPRSGGPSDGDPVDLQTGLFVMSHSDLVAPDVTAAALTRTYRQNDNVMRSFGLGQSDDFNVFVAPDGTGRYLVQMPDGSSVPFAPGPDGVYRAVDTPTDFQGAVMSGQLHTDFTVTFRDGRVWTFGSHAAMLISKSDRDGNTVTYDRDFSTGQVSRVTSPNGKWIALTWGACGPTAQCVTRATDTIGRSVKYAYDVSGRLTTVTNPAGRTTVYTWNACADALTCTQMASIKDANNVTYLRNSFDSNGRVSKQLQADNSAYAFEYTLDEAGHVTATTVTNPRGAKHRVEFNAAGYSTVDTTAFGTALEQITTITRAASTNLVTSVVDPLGRRTNNTYDSTGQLLTSTSAVGTPLAQTQSFTYEPKYGRLASVTNALGKKSTIAYDDENDIVTATDPLGHSSKTEFLSGQPVRSTDALGNVTTMSYLDGALVVVRDPLGRATSSYSDNAGRLIKSTDPIGKRVTYAYDVMNQLIGSTDPLGSSSSTTYDANGNPLTHTDPLGRVTKSTYDAMNRLISSTDALGKVETYTYDAAGALSAMVDRNGIRTVATYDQLDRPAVTGYRAVTAGTSTTYESTVTHTYDKGDRLTKVIDTAGGTLTYAYDGLDRMTGETGAAGTVGYSYDIGDRRTGMTVPGQSATAYTYDLGGRLSAITRGTQNVGFTYDNADRRLTTTLPGNLKQTYAYDAASQMTGIAYTAGAAAQGNLAYVYDAAGRPSAVGGSLAKVTLPAVWSAATYNAKNQLTKLGTKTFTYDAGGRLTNDGTATYTWDARDQLTATGTSSFTYDAAGRRATRKVGATVSSFVYDGANMVQERSGSTVSADLLTGSGPDETFTRTQAGVTSALMTDRLGSTVGLANASGVPTTSYTYEPFGKATATGTASTNAFQFTGRENDGTGLQYNRARYYSPALQRFISEDPLGAQGSGDNVYAYAENSPTVLSDPTGEFAFLLPLLGACALGAVESAAIGWATAAWTGQKYTLGDAGRDALTGCAFGVVGAGVAAGAKKAFDAWRAARAARRAAEGAESAAKTCLRSFSGETLVLMGDGTKKPISHVAVGDEVLTTDPETGEQSIHKVSYVWVHRDDLSDLTVDGQAIRTTEDHPFWSVTDQRFERTDELAAGEKLLMADGRLATVTSMKRANRATFDAYNLSIEGVHTYYVGPRAILVHNSCGINLVYEANPKHGPVSYQGPRGEVSRAPRGDCQAMLACSTQVKPRLREGVEPDTGLTVIFRRHREFDGTEWWHGFVPGG
jgi:RHS repeat-associated protein